VSTPEPGFAGRGGIKLSHALREFGVDVAGHVCADFGCSVGGFTDCLLRRGAVRVYAVDAGYGMLAWSLRTDPRVVVMERVNALHADPPEPVSLVSIDLGWTPQRLAVPAALRWLAPGGRIVTLVKPQYELDARDARRLLRAGVLPEPEAERVALEALERMPGLGARVEGWARSPIPGGSSRKGRGGNAEWVALLAPA
jgi:23S rRNA (cytidine1920-2'-O)/16S rRNA (cytidine1409-2'-O)-methyltransferase